MRLDKILDEKNVVRLLEEMMELGSPAKDKGSDPIKVRAFVVHAHWRKRVMPRKRRAKIIQLRQHTS